jgi:hypothetical protein
VSLLITLLIALFLAVPGCFFFALLPWRIPLRITNIDLLIRLLLGLPFLSQALPWKVLIECLFCLYSVRPAGRFYRGVSRAAGSHWGNDSLSVHLDQAAGVSPEGRSRWG